MTKKLVQERIYYIYRITNLINENTYVGKHINKIGVVDNYMGSGTYLKRAKEKYGIQNFKKEIIKYCENENDLKEWEKTFIMLERFMCRAEYNVADGGDGSGIEGGRKNLGKKRTPEQCKRISEATKEAMKHLSPEKEAKLYYRKGKEGPNKGRHWSDATKKLISEHSGSRGKHPANYGKHHDEVTREKMKDAWKERKNRSPNKGRHFYTNGIKNIMAFQCPEGYHEGKA